MRAGELRDVIIIRSKRVTQNAYGEEVISWRDFCTAWAKVEPLRGNEFVALLAAGDALMTRFTLRYVAGVTLDMQLEHNGSIYDMSEIINPGARNISLEIFARTQRVAS